MCFCIIGTTILHLSSHNSMAQKMFRSASLLFKMLHTLKRHQKKSSQWNALPYSVNTKLADVCFTFVISNDFFM
jgi:hypothetical protein